MLILGRRIESKDRELGIVARFAICDLSILANTFSTQHTIYEWKISHRYDSESLDKLMIPK